MIASLYHSGIALGGIIFGITLMVAGLVLLVSVARDERKGTYRLTD